MEIGGGGHCTRDYGIAGTTRRGATAQTVRQLTPAFDFALYPKYSTTFLVLLLSPVRRSPRTRRELSISTRPTNDFGESFSLASFRRDSFNERRHRRVSTLSSTRAPSPTRQDAKIFFRCAGGETCIYFFF